MKIKALLFDFMMVIMVFQIIIMWFELIPKLKAQYNIELLIWIDSNI